MAISESTTQAMRRLQRVVVHAANTAQTLQLAGGDTPPPWVDFHSFQIDQVEHALEQLEMALTKEADR